MNTHRKRFSLLVIAGSLATAGGCVSYEEPVRPAPTLTFVATEDAPIVAPPTVSQEVAFAGPAAPDSAEEERAENKRLSRFTSAANELRIRHDNLAATIALAPEVVDFSGREKLAHLRTIISEIEGGLLRLKLARAESAPAIGQELERLLAEGNQRLMELSAEIANRRFDARK